MAGWGDCGSVCASGGGGGGGCREFTSAATSLDLWGVEPGSVAGKGSVCQHVCPGVLGGGGGCE